MTASRLHIQIVAALTVAVFAVGIWASGDTLRFQWLRFYSAAVLCAVVALAVWDQWLWRLPIVQRIGGVPRDLHGTWRGSLEAYWVGPDGVRPAKRAYLVVRQTASKVSVILLTDESRSASSLATVSSDVAMPTLDYMYLNRPDTHLEAQSRMHYGSASLDVSGRPAARLRGRYWTNRDSRGQCDFLERIQRLADDYDEAERLFRVVG
jgi:hypothetical protein